MKVLYCYWKDGGRGLFSIVDAHTCRVVSLCKHIRQAQDRNHCFSLVYRREESDLVRKAQGLKEDFHIMKIKHLKIRQHFKLKHKLNSKIKNNISLDQEVNTDVSLDQEKRYQM